MVRATKKKNKQQKQKEKKTHRGSTSMSCCFRSVLRMRTWSGRIRSPRITSHLVPPETEKEEGRERRNEWEKLKSCKGAADRLCRAQCRWVWKGRTADPRCSPVRWEDKCLSSRLCVCLVCLCVWLGRSLATASCCGTSAASLQHTYTSPSSSDAALLSLSYRSHPVPRNGELLQRDCSTHTHRPVAALPLPLSVFLSHRSHEVPRNGELLRHQRNVTAAHINIAQQQRGLSLFFLAHGWVGR
jgi:hypothetical protein